MLIGQANIGTRSPKIVPTRTAENTEYYPSNTENAKPRAQTPSTNTPHQLHYGSIFAAIFTVRFSVLYPMINEVHSWSVL
jgi:hypothetical protein